MELTGFSFFCFFAAVLLLYYLVPGRLRWGVLLIASLAFYLLSGNGWRILFPLAASLLTWLCIRILTGTTSPVARRAALIAELSSLVGILLVFKALGFAGVAGISPPLGLSFYTFTLLGYFLDVWQQIAEPVSLPGTLLYGMYFPAMVTGPIVKLREDGRQFFEPQPPDYDRITCGLQRMLWGIFKKLVIAERLGILVAEIYGNDERYPGAFIWFGTVCFAFQLYADFGGCMDIVLGLSEALGLRLPENFRAPFLAESVADYWRRWHITLGDFMKERVFYPLLRTRFFMRQGELLRKRFGKKTGKKFNTWLAMLVLWTAIGLWHGGALKYLIGSGLLHWFYIVTGEATAPLWTKLYKRLSLDPGAMWLRVFRVIRTFFLVCIGFVFFRADSAGHALRLLRESVSVWNPAVLLNGSLFELGLGWIECGVLLVSLALMIAVEVASWRADERQAAVMSASGGVSAEGADTRFAAGHAVRRRIASQKLPVRWAVWLALLFYVILLGQYGPGVSAAEFIYQGF